MDFSVTVSMDVVALNMYILACFDTEPERLQPNGDLLMTLDAALQWELENGTPDMHAVADLRDALLAIQDLETVTSHVRRGLYLLDTLEIVQEHKQLLLQPIMNRFGTHPPPATAAVSGVAKDLVAVFQRFCAAAGPYVNFAMPPSGDPAQATAPPTQADPSPSAGDHCSSCEAITPHDIDRSRSATRTCLVCFATEKLTAPASSCHDLLRISQITRSAVQRTAGGS